MLWSHLILWMNIFQCWELCSAEILTLWCYCVSRRDSILHNSWLDGQMPENTRQHIRSGTKIETTLAYIVLVNTIICYGRRYKWKTGLSNKVPNLCKYQNLDGIKNMLKNLLDPIGVSVRIMQKPVLTKWISCLINQINNRWSEGLSRP